MKYSELKFVLLDVSHLPPPEPMTMILSKLAALAEHECLQIKHRRQPFPLYEKLKSAGFCYQCVVHNQDSITLYIYHEKVESVIKALLIEQK